MITEMGKKAIEYASHKMTKGKRIKFLVRLLENANNWMRNEMKKKKLNSIYQCW